MKKPAKQKVKKTTKKIVNKKPKGLGDTIEKITKATGIKKVVKAIFGDDCGCNERKEKLNEIFAIERPSQRCLEEHQYEQYKMYRETRTLNVWNEAEMHFIIKLYAHVFALQYNVNDLCRNCDGSAKILLRISKELDTVFESHK